MRKQFFLIIVFNIVVIMFVWTASTVSAKELKVNNLDGRYQYIKGPVAKVFDTHTGKAYLWFPRNEEKDQQPYVFIQDFVNQVGTTVEIKWETKKAK